MASRIGLRRVSKAIGCVRDEVACFACVQEIRLGAFCVFFSAFYAFGSSARQFELLTHPSNAAPWPKSETAVRFWAFRDRASIFLRQRTIFLGQGGARAYHWVQKQEQRALALCESCRIDT